MCVHRWDVEQQLTADPPARFGAWLRAAPSGSLPRTGDALRFDAAAMGLSEQEAALVNPEHRLLLELAAEVLAVPACAADQPVRAAAGVFFGISTPDFADIAKTHSRINAFSATGMEMQTWCLLQTMPHTHYSHPLLSTRCTSHPCCDLASLCCFIPQVPHSVLRQGACHICTTSKDPVWQ